MDAALLAVAPASPSLAAAPPSGRPARPPAETLTEAAAVELALRNSVGARRVLAGLDVAAAEAAGLARPADPGVEGEYLPGEAGESRVGLEVPLTELLVTPARARFARAAVDAHQLDATSELARLGLEVRYAYHAVQAAAALRDLAAQSLEAYRAADAAATALFEAGNLSGVELARHRTASLLAEEALTRRALQLAAARADLAALAGLDPAADAWGVSPDLVEAPAGAASVDRPDAASDGPSLREQAAGMRLEMASRGVTLARVDAWVPELHVGPIAAWDAVERRWSVGAAATLELPIFGARAAGVRVASANSGLAELGVEDAGLEGRSAVARATAALALTAAAADRCSRETVPSARRLRDEVQLQYNAMQVGIFDLLAALQLELEAQARCVEWSRDYADALADSDALARGVTPRFRAAMSPSGATVPQQTHGAH
ncbi:MAG: TolC family protein [Myxococcales bacterium]|nr:TolC family protein [Myxococcales bacterium]